MSDPYETLTIGIVIPEDKLDTYRTALEKRDFSVKTSVRMPFGGLLLKVEIFRAHLSELRTLISQIQYSIQFPNRQDHQNDKH